MKNLSIFEPHIDKHCAYIKKTFIRSTCFTFPYLEEEILELVQKRGSKNPKWRSLLRNGVPLLKGGLEKLGSNPKFFKKSICLQSSLRLWIWLMPFSTFSYTASLLKFFNVNNNSSIEKSFLKFKTKFRFTESKEALRPIPFREGKFKRGN